MDRRAEIDAFFARLDAKRASMFKLVFDLRPHLIKVPCGKYGDTFNFKVGPEVIDWCNDRGFSWQSRVENGEYDVAECFFPTADIATLFKLTFG